MVLKLKIEEVSPSVSRLRSVTSQVIACLSPNLLLLDLGMAVSFSTIAMPDLLNAKEGLSLNDTQASWFGSLSYMTQPLGALLSGPLVDYFGRKKANFLVNIPHLLAWTLMHFAWNLPSLFIANGLLGLGTGIMEAPINSYVGEISEPSMRGALCTLTQVFSSIGVFIMYFLGTVVTWRLAALICLAAPICSMLMILLVPETPVWLLAQGREQEALDSLRYVRGWTTEDQVKDEFDQLNLYAKNLQRCVICWNESPELKDCPHQNMNSFKRWILKIRYVMLCKETLRPLTMVMMYFLFHVMCSTMPVRPNLVNLCGAFGMADNGKNIVMMIGVITFITSILTVGIIKIFGKRKLAINAMLGTACSFLALSIYAKMELDDSIFSYDISTFQEKKSYVPMVFLYCLTLFTGFGIPWVLLGEVFPYRSRALAQGLAAAGNYVIMFIGSKTFINLELSTKLWGTCLVYSMFGFVGTIYLYFFLPETEGKSLQEIESYYSGEFRTFADDPVANCFKRFKKKM